MQYLFGILTWNWNLLRDAIGWFDVVYLWSRLTTGYTIELLILSRGNFLCYYTVISECSAFRCSVREATFLKETVVIILYTAVSNIYNLICAINISEYRICLKWPMPSSTTLSCSWNNFSDEMVSDLKKLLIYSFLPLRIGQSSWDVWGIKNYFLTY